MVVPVTTPPLPLPAVPQPFVTDCTYDDGEGGEEEAAETAG